METQQKFKIDEKYLEALNKTADAVWESTDEYMVYCPFDNQKELDESLECLFRMMDFNCFTAAEYPEHQQEKQMFEYFPIKAEISIQEKVTKLPRDKHALWIRYKRGMRYLCEE